MLYKHLVVFIIIILLMFSIHYVEPNPPVREGFLDLIETELRKSKVGSDIADVGVDIGVFKEKSKPLPVPPRTYDEIWRGVPYGKLYSGVDITSKSYYEKQKKKTEEFREMWTCLGGTIPVRIHPYNEHILETHPAGEKICKGYAGIMYDINAPDGPDRSDTESEYNSHTPKMSSILRKRIGSLNDGYGEEPVSKNGGGFIRLNKYYDSSSNPGKVRILSQDWNYWYEYNRDDDRKNKINATHIVFRRNGSKDVKLKIPDTVKKLNDIYGIYCANHIPEDSFYYTEWGIGSSEEWPDDAMLTDFNCNTGSWPPSIQKTDIFKESKYVDDRTGKPIHKNVKRYSKSGSPTNNLVLECQESYRDGKPNNCRNPALWEARCKAIKKLCENSLPYALEKAGEDRENSQVCEKDSQEPMCLIRHPNCGLTNDNEKLNCEKILISDEHGYDKSNPPGLNYWNKDIYKKLNVDARVPLEESRTGGSARAGRGKGNYNRTRGDDYFKNKEIYGNFINFAELPIGPGILR